MLDTYMRHMHQHSKFILLLGTSLDGLALAVLPYLHRRPPTDCCQL